MLNLETRSAAVSNSNSALRSAQAVKQSGAQGIASALMLCGVMYPAIARADNTVSLRYGTAFKEPFVARGADIAKTIYSYSHSGTDSLGASFFSADLLLSNTIDPPNNGATSGTGAQAAVLIGRYVVSLNKATGSKSFALPGMIRDVGIRANAIIDTKNTASATEKQFFSLGPQIAFDTSKIAPGYFNVSVSSGQERNYNGVVGRAVRFNPAAEIAANWEFKFPFGITTANFTGNFAYNAPKGTDARGNQSTWEFRARPELLFDVGEPFGRKDIIEAGFAYEIWDNKFGNDAAIVPGAKARTPMVVGKAHF